MSYVYFLKLSNEDIYVGFTRSLKKRLESHRNGEVDSTKNLLPFTLKSYIYLETPEEAARLERYFKSGSGKAFAMKRLCK